ncbi:MAG: CPBP family intramembrane metalloprotease [Bacteroidaceae bacterium]|nr:CPBP family intramembrane metalloprotease [Bacteroidaceae bacterium]
MELQIKSMPIWKWAIELVLGIIIFFIVYGIAGSALIIELRWLVAIVCIISGVAIIGLFQLWTRAFEKEWRMDTICGLGKLWSGITIGALFFCIVTGILAAIGAYHASYASPHWGMIVVNLCFYFLVACGEEVIFRGVLFRLIDEKFSFWWAIVVSSLVFGFAHIFQPYATVWSSIAITVEAGILLGTAYKYAGTLWLPIGIHWAWNFTQGNVFGLEVSGGETEESIMNATLTGPDIITGGSFGPEASIITAILGILLSCLFIYLVKNRNSTSLTESEK